MKAGLRNLYETLIRPALKFGVVGAGGYVIDTGLFNLLSINFSDDGHALASPLMAKVVASAVAISATWFGNRYWTFRDHRRKNFLLELVEFFAVAVAGLGISLLCLYVSHYVLGYTSLLADNISANVIGVGLAMIFRFFLYRYWVFAPGRKDAASNLATEEAKVPSLIA